MKDILVVTPTMGDRSTLKRTINSVKKIGGGRISHIIVTPQHKISKVKALIGNDIALEVEPQGSKGIYPALNYVFKKYGHEYKYLAFLNDDDFWLPNFTQIICAANGETGLVYGKVNYLFNGQTVPMACSKRFCDFIPLLYSGVILFTQQASLIRSDIYFEVGGFDESFKLAADSLFWAKVSLLGIKYKYIATPCAMYTFQQGQLSSDRITSEAEHNRVLDMLPRPKQLQIAIAKLRFRLSNVRTYVERIFSHNRKVSDFLVS